MRKMEITLKSKWIEALTNGEYIQTKGLLFDGYLEDGKPKMCCLGVLESICGTNNDIILGLAMPYDIKDEKYNVIRKSPEEILGQTICLEGVSTTIETNLASMNDEGKTFEEIAEYIKENL